MASNSPPPRADATAPVTTQTVRSYWEHEPIGTRGRDTADDSFFEQTERERVRLEGSLIAPFAEFERWRGRRVLEVGIGSGADFLRWARAGAHATGVDLTLAGVQLARRRLAREGLSAPVVRGDAQSLPFAAGAFDLVWSWGVLHHAPDTPATLAEVRRVLKPGGEARIMLYHRRSWVGLQLWLRWAVFGGHPTKSLRRIIHDHLESPGTKAYEPDEAAAMFRAAGFSDVEVETRLTAWDLRTQRPDPGRHGRALSWVSTAAYPRPLVRALGDRFGFFLLIRAVA